MVNYSIPANLGLQAHKSTKVVLKGSLSSHLPKVLTHESDLGGNVWFSTCSAVRSQGNVTLPFGIAVQSCGAVAMHLLKYLQVELPLRCLGLVKVVLL